jgi:hypothetical protein
LIKKKKCNFLTYPVDFSAVLLFLYVDVTAGVDNAVANRGEENKRHRDSRQSVP